MNRTLKYALSAVITGSLVAPVLAQDNFPDVPDNHWAYEALKNMKKDGLLVGYPDSLFRGGRPASRYELAVAVHATYQRLKGITDGLDSQIKAMTASLDGKADKADLQALRDALDALKNDVEGMKAWGDDIANLKKLTATFEKEIASLGVDVEAMKKDLGDLKDRVDKLEKRKPAVDIHGTVDLLGMGGYSTSDRFGITVDARPTGIGRGSYNGVPVGMNRDLSIFHEGALTFSGTNMEGPKWHATLVTGNMLGDSSMGSDSKAFGDQAHTLDGWGFREGNTNVYFQDFVVSFDTSLVGQNFSAEVGRTGYKISPYLFQRPDTTPYFANDRWDNGKWMFDGAIIGFHLGPAKLVAFGGRKSGQEGTWGDPIQQMEVGRNGNPFVLSDFSGTRPWGLNGGAGSLGMPIDQFLGLHLSAPLAEKADLNLAYLWLDSNSVGALSSTVLYNRLAVYGGDLKVKLDPFVLDGGYAATNLQYNQHNVLDKDNYAWWVNGAYKTPKWGVNVGYRELQQNFAAPGDWGRIGTWWNPVGIKGVQAGANFDFTESLTIKATGEWYTGINKSFNPDSALNSDDKINRYVVGLGYKLNPSWNLDLGWEYVQYDIKTRPDFFENTFFGGKPQEQWFNIGLNYGFNNNAKLMILWQISDYDAKGLLPFAFMENNKATGGLLTTQLSVKF